VLAVSGAPGGSTVATVSLTLSGYRTTSANGNGANGAHMGLLLKSPGSRNLEIMRSIGQAATDVSNLTFTIQDSGAAMPNGCDNLSVALANNATYKPSAYACPPFPVPDYTTNGGPALAHSAQTVGTSTLNSTNGVFTGDTPNGNWSLYLVDTDTDADVSFTGWSITITVSSASTPSTTTLTPSPSTAYRTSPNNGVTLTATVTSGATGTITFKEGSTNLTCSGGNPATIASNQAVCSTSFSTEGIHALTANYSGDGTFVASSGNANVYIQNHATNTGNTYCNGGGITNNGRSDLAFSNTAPYPSVIFVGDGVNTDIANSVNTVSVTLNSFSATGTNAMHMLLVAPDGTHAYDFWSNVGSSASAGTYTIADGHAQIPNITTISPGTYSPTADGTPPDPFTPAPPTPAPQIPGSFFYATPEGDPNSKTFQTAFAGAAAHGAWSLFLYNASGTGVATSAGSWCLNISPGTGFATTVSVMASPTRAAQGSSVTFTATVASAGHPTPNQGTVTFTENGSPLTGAPNGGVANVVSGVATIMTSGLPEGDHNVTGAYHDNAGTYNDNFGTVAMRVDKATSAPTFNGTTFNYCNAGAITIPQGVLFVNDTGPGTPNPSNVFVTLLPGTIKTVGLTLKGFTVFRPSDLESLLVGPNGASAPTVAQTLDFFSLTGGINNYGPADTSFLDTGAVVPANSPPGASNAPTSRGATAYTASPFYTLPGTLQHATTQGAFTFNTGADGNPAVYKDTNGNGTWSLYFNQITHSTGSGVNSGWCVNFTENPPVLTATKGPSGLHVVQGDTGDSVTVDVQNASGPGSAGGADPLKVSDTFPAGLTPTGGSGTDWTCSAPVGQTITCTSSDFIAPGSSFPTLTLNFNVSATATAPATVSNTAAISGSALTASVNSNTLSISVDPAPDVTVTPTHTGTFTQGSTGAIQITAHNAIASSKTKGTTTVVDTLPTGWTLSSFTSTANVWTCGSNMNIVTCTNTQQISGVGDYTELDLTVNIPNNSAVHVTNSVTISGGGELNLPAYTGNDTSTDSITVVQVPASIAINGNATQSAPINTAFGSLAVTVKDAANVAIPNYSSAVFTAVAGGSGQSGTFAGPSSTATVMTDGSGVADPGTFTANNKVGAYTVDVAAGPATHATFNLTNTAPDLTAAKSDNVSHATTLGNSWTWKITVSNTGTSSAAFTSSQVILTDDLPNSNITYGSASASNIVGTITNSNAILCSIASSSLSCTANLATVTMAASSSFDVTFTATPSAVGTFANPRNLGTCAVDPNTLIAESNENNNSCSDTVTVTAPDLIVSKTHGPNSNFTVGEQGDTFTITATNQGNAATSGTVTVTDTLPAGLTYASFSGTGWSCSANLQVVTCTRTTAIAASGGSSQVTISVNVASSTSSPLTNNVSVGCTCTESDTTNNTNTDSVTVIQLVNTTLDTSPTGLLVSADGGGTFTAPHTYSFVPGSSHTISTTSPQTGGGFQYTWTSWSDSGAISHMVTAPSSPTTFTANFSTQVQLTTLVSPGAAAGSISPATGYVNPGAMVSVSATPMTGYVFTGFTGGLTGTTNPQTITVNSPATVTANFGPGPTSLGGTLTGKTGVQNARVWSFTISNPGPGIALSTRATSFTLTQTAGAACTPVINTPFPVVLGDIAPAGSAPMNVTIDFTGCVATAKFTLTMPLSANSGAGTGTIALLNQFR
jgi:uncharacterized repeat protein (TIGR01451 family)